MVVKNDTLIRLASLVRQTRKAARLSQNELAELAGVGKTLIFDLEKGHENIQFVNLKKIMNVLNIKMTFTPPNVISKLKEQKKEKIKRKKVKS